MELLKELMTARHTIAVALKDVSNGRFEIKQILVRKTGSSNPRKCYDFDVVLKQIVAEQAEHIVISEVKKPRCPQEVTHKETRRLASTTQCAKIQQTYETNRQQSILQDANLSSIVDTIATGLFHEINEGIQKLSGSFDAMESVSSAGNRECQGTKGGTKSDMVAIATIHFDKLKSEEAVKPNVNAAKDDETGTTSTSRVEELEDMHDMNTDVLTSCHKDMHNMNTDIVSDCSNLDGKNNISSADDINMANPQSLKEDHVANEDYSLCDNDDSDRDPDWQPPTENTAKKQAISNIDAKSSCRAKSGNLCDVEKGETGGNLVALTTHQNQEAEKSKIPLLSSLTSKRVCGLKYSSVQFYEFECFFCPGKRVYNSWSLLGKHILKAHCKRGDDCRFRIDCLYECGKTFYLTFSNSKGCPVDSLSNLQTRLGEVLNHFNCKHKREFPKCVKVFTCPVFVCGYSHVIATNVQRHHKETHLSRDRFTCEKCGKNWCSKNSLKRHIIKECSSKLPVEKKKAPTSCTTMAVAGEQIGNVIRMLSGQTFPNSREPFSVSQTTGHIESCQRGPCNAEHVFDRNSLDLSEATDLSQTSDMESVENCENPSDVKECSQEFESEETQKEGTSGQDIKETYDVSKVINNSPKPSFGSDAYRQTRDKFYSITFKEHKCFLCVDEPLFRGEKGLGMHMFRKHCSAGPNGVWEIQCPQKACNKLFHFRKKKEQPYSRTDVLIRKLPSVYMHLYRKHDFGSLHYVKMPKCHAEGCDFRHVLPSVMQRHFKNVHGEKLLVPCDKCGVQIQEKYLSKHKKIHCKAIEAYDDPSNRLPCPQCDKTFKTTDGLDTHIKIIHENRHRVYMCEICSYTARHPNALEQHMFKAHDHNPKGLPIFQCEHCDYRVVWERAYRKHVETIHNKKNKACEECGLTFTGHNAMKRHNETHSSEVYQCDQCTYSTKHKIYFQRHTRAQHKKSRAFPCKYCPYKSGYSENTLKHMKSCGRKHGVPGT